MGPKISFLILGSPYLDQVLTNSTAQFLASETKTGRPSQPYLIPQHHLTTHIGLGSEAVENVTGSSFLKSICAPYLQRLIVLDKAQFHQCP